ncbi:tubulointerstitial nephritis antigen isoform X1 [Taeniopygia guttata]|uniref:tubulointerstitial nephritis antigen isoform X1 n=1 Tax=Taeniopygia guttata TaxID=59729 RepID=UPI003BB933A5
MLAGCYKDGRYYGEGTIIKDNCNSCKCFNSLWKCSTDVCLVRQDLIQHINSGDFGWKADNYSQFWGMTVEEGFKKRLGTFPPSHSLLNMREVPGKSLPEEKFPAIFSAIYEWPEWIHDPLDQRNCGASWAFSTASVAADRIAIHSKGQITDNLSAQNLISCDTRNQHGCNGGSIDGAWRYLKTHGVVSYACYPSFWNKHLGPSAENQCYVSSEYGKNHTNGPCPNAFEKSNRLYRCASHYRVSSKETDIMKEIKDRGPVQAIMKVYEDFFLYKEGIYQHSQKAGSKWKTHSVKLLGWGALPDKNGQKQKFWDLQLGVKMSDSRNFLRLAVGPCALFFSLPRDPNKKDEICPSSCKKPTCFYSRKARKTTELKLQNHSCSIFEITYLRAADWR